MSYIYMTVDELQLIHTWLTHKLSTLSTTDESTSDYSESNLTKGILTFIKHLLEREISSSIFSNDSFVSCPRVSSGCDTTYYSADTDSVCPQCELIYPKPTTCIHRVKC